MRVDLRRIEPGRYAVLETRGLARYPTPLLVVRKRETRASKGWGNAYGRTVVETWWSVEFDGKTTLGEIARFKAERIPDWDYHFGRYSEGLDTLAEVKQRLEEVLRGGGRAGAAGSAPAAALHGGDARAGEPAGGGGGG